MSQIEKLDRWDALPDDTRKEFDRISVRRGRNRLLLRYTLAVLAVVVILLAGAGCIVIALLGHPIGVLLVAGIMFLMLGWIPFAQMASSAKRDLLAGW
jgi:hypothetical protein